MNYYVIAITLLLPGCGGISSGNWEFAKSKSIEAYSHLENEISNCLRRAGCSIRGKEGHIGETVIGPQGDRGASGDTGTQGSAGTQGIQGIQGETGVAGDTGDTGAQGEQGEQGVAGTNGSDSIVEVIDPCGDDPGFFDEVLLRLNGGQLIAYFRDGNREMLAVISPGNYKTTDRQQCRFTVTQDLQIVD